MDWADTDYSDYEEDDSTEEDASLWVLMREMRRTDLDSSGETADAQPYQPSLEAYGRNKRAQRFSAFAQQAAASGELLISEAGQAFVYQKDRGFFKPVPKLDAYLAGFFGEEITNNLLFKDLQEIEKRLLWIEAIRCPSDGWNANNQLVNLEDGVFNIKTGELLPFDACHRFTYQIHASRVKDADRISCPVFDAFCQSSLEGDPAKRQLLLEFIGYICMDTNNGKCALFLKGQPNSGKSVMGDFVSRLFDQELVSNIPLHQLGDRFFRAELMGKKLNAAGEISGNTLKDISIFKSITGNDRIAGEFKGKDPFYFTPRCKLLFSGNTLPLTTETDTTTAFVNRIRVLLFNVSVPTEQQDKHLPEKLWGERNSIVTLALQAARKLAERNYIFTEPEDSREFLEAFQTRGNILHAFLEECCILAPKARCFNVELYTEFKAFCERNGLDCLKKAKFYDLLSGVSHVAAKRLRIGGESKQGHIGITLKENPHYGTLEQMQLNPLPRKSSGRSIPKRFIRPQPEPTYHSFEERRPNEESND